MFSKVELENLSCEIIDTFNRFNIDDSYWILLSDKHYDSTDGWKNGTKDIYDYVPEEYKNEILNKEFNLMCEFDVREMFWYNPAELYEAYDTDEEKELAKNLIKCYSKLRRIFRRYNLKWEVIDYGFVVTFDVLR